MSEVLYFNVYAHRDFVCDGGSREYCDGRAAKKFETDPFLRRIAVLRVRLKAA